MWRRCLFTHFIFLSFLVRPPTNLFLIKIRFYCANGTNTDAMNSFCITRIPATRAYFMHSFFAYRMKHWTRQRHITHLIDEFFIWELHIYSLHHNSNAFLGWNKLLPSHAHEHTIPFIFSFPHSRPQTKLNNKKIIATLEIIARDY